ncbi:hypothetical protein Q7P35_012585 [Cladosporium inversicolor]
MARTKYTSGDPVTTHDGVEYTTKNSNETGKRTTHYTNEVPDGPTSTTYQDTEQHLFAFPDLLVGDKVLEIGAKYTNNQIAAKIADAAVENGPILTESGVAHRVRSAVAKRAQEQNVEYDDVMATFKESRKSNGVATRAPRVPKAKQTGKKTLAGPAVDDDDEADDQSATYKEDSGGERKGSPGSELTELESDAEA